MTRLCIIGNSHVASLKLGWDEIRGAHPSVRLTFFAHRGPGMTGLRAEGGKLLPGDDDLRRAMLHTSGGLDAIDFGHHDACLVHGLGLRVSPPGTHVFYSSSVRALAAEDQVCRSAAWEVLGRVREVSDIRVFVGHAPILAGEADGRTARIEEYSRWITALDERFFSPRGATLLPQPASTLTEHLATDVRYSVGARRLDVGDGAATEVGAHGDRMHVNAEFGALYLEALFERLTRP